MEKLKIYLGDITYDTVSLSTEAIPLAIGYVAAYCKKIYGSQVEITLFKYLEELEKALIDSPPDIIGLSNYTWNQNIGIEMFKLARQQNPNVLTVWGGPNFPIDFPTQKKFMNEFSIVDIYVPLEGELGFSNIVEIALTLKEKNNIIQEFNNYAKKEKANINLGTYIVKKNILNEFKKEPLSFENDILPKLVKKKKVQCSFFPNNFFLDIGVNSDLKKAKSTIQKYEQ